MKRKVETSETSESKKNSNESNNEKAACPSYGSQSYWDERYKNNSAKDDQATISMDDKISQVEEEGSPGFSWYFSYNELRPLLLPLLLGRDEEEEEWSDCEEMEEILEGSDDDDDDDNVDGGESDASDDSDEVDAKEELEEEIKTDDSNEKNAIEEVEESETETDAESEHNHEKGNGDGETSLDESFAAKLKDPKRPPKTFLEIGCGDVPLGAELCIDLLKLQEIAKADAKLAVVKIVCFDYSKMCIDLLLRQQEEEQKDTSEHAPKQLRVDYKVHDARDLPYKDSEFHVIVDKGTLDAMLSDKVEGKRNCIKIVSEAARILAVDGYILIVSHLNANGPEGLSWIDEVLATGLKDGDSASDWRIEVHGNDADDDADEDDVAPDGQVNVNIQENAENEDDGLNSPSTQYGPAVYIIRKIKGSKDQGQDDSSRVDMKFFGY